LRTNSPNRNSSRAFSLAAPLQYARPSTLSVFYRIPTVNASSLRELSISISRLELPYLVVNYSKCDGDGACISGCPGSIFERSTDGLRCKPLDDFVKNSPALESFYGRVNGSAKPVNFAIRYHVPECFLCWQCVGACPKQAIDVEYDDLDVREYLLEVGD